MQHLIRSLGAGATVACTRFRRHRVRCFYGPEVDHGETKAHTRFKPEAVRLIRDRRVSYAQAPQDLNVHPTQLRNWVKAFADDPQEAFPGQGRMKPEQLEIARLKARGDQAEG
jgi:transposase